MTDKTKKATWMEGFKIALYMTPFTILAILTIVSLFVEYANGTSIINMHNRIAKFVLVIPATCLTALVLFMYALPPRQFPRIANGFKHEYVHKWIAGVLGGVLMMTLFGWVVTNPSGGSWGPALGLQLWAVAGLLVIAVRERKRPVK